MGSSDGCDCRLGRENAAGGAGGMRQRCGLFRDDDGSSGLRVPRWLC